MLGLVLVLTGCLASVLTPLLITLLHGSAAHGQLEQSLFVIAVALLHIVGVSSIYASVNAAIVALAIGCGLVLARSMARLGSVATLVGGWALLSWIVLALVALLLFEGGQRRVAPLADASHCEYSAAGHRNWGRGGNVARFKRYGIIDLRIASNGYMGEHFCDSEPPPGLQACYAVLTTAR